MAKLHWIVYVIAGLILTFGSRIIDREKLIMFFYAGFVFLLIGIIKFIYSRNALEAANRGNKALQQHFSRQNPHKNVKYCQNCGAPSAMSANFCRQCGTRF